MLSIYTDLCLKQVSDTLTLICDSIAISVVFRVRESAVMNVIFMHVQVDITVYAK